MSQLRKAILVGSNKYETTPLNFSIKDVSDFQKNIERKCKFLSENIYKILFQKDCDEPDFRTQLDSFINTIESERKNILDLILFYFSGHGYYNSEDEMSYLKISDNQHLSINEIVEKISEIKAKNKYIIIDACFSGGISIFSAKSYLDRKHKFNSEGLYLLFGATSNKMSYEPSLKHQIEKKITNSYFTYFILEALSEKSLYQDGTISLKVIDDFASRKTPTYTDFSQIPYSSSQTSGFFPFGYWDEESEYIDIKSILLQDNNKQYSKNTESEVIDYLTSRISLLFNKEIPVLMNYEKELLHSLSPAAIDILNFRLKFDKAKLDDKPFLHSLILSGDHDMFLDFILNQTIIKLDFDAVDDFERNLLQICVEEESIKYVFRYIMLIFKNGFRASLTEFEYYKTLFKKEPLEPNLLERITYVLINIKVDNPNFSELIYSNFKLLFVFLSFKHNKVIGYKLNFLALANNFLQHHSDFGEYFIKLLKHYDYYDLLMKNESFRKKVSTIETKPPYQNQDLNNLLTKLLPEIK